MRTTLNLDDDILLAARELGRRGHKSIGEVVSELARRWLKEHMVPQGWASCPLTQNGFIRIMCQSRYARPFPASQAIDMLEEAAGTKHHGMLVTFDDSIQLSTVQGATKEHLVVL